MASAVGKEQAQKHPAAMFPTCLIYHWNKKVAFPLYASIICSKIPLEGIFMPTSPDYSLFNHVNVCYYSKCGTKPLLWNQHPPQLLYWSACPYTFHGEIIFPHLSLVSTTESKYSILLKSQCSEPYRLKILKTQKIISFNSQKNANIRTEMYHVEKCWTVHSTDFSSWYWRHFPWTTYAVQFSWGAQTHRTFR